MFKNSPTSQALSNRPQIYHVSCAAHVLNLIIKKMEQIIDPQHILEILNDDND